MSAEQLPLFPEEGTTMPHDEPPVTVAWVTDATGHVSCRITADCGCEGEVVQTGKIFTSRDEWIDAIDEAVMLTARGILAVMCDHEDDAEDVSGILRGVMWTITNHALLRTGWETAMPFLIRPNPLNPDHGA